VGVYEDDVWLTGGPTAECETKIMMGA